MLEELMNKVRQYGESLVVQNPAVPNEHNEDVLKEAGASIFSGLQEFAGKGDTNGLSGLLSGEENHPAMTEVKNNFADNITQKFGINGGTAKTLAATLIPSILGSLLKRPGAGNNAGISLDSILSSLTGGGNMQQDGFLNSMGEKLGLDRNGDGRIDLSDVTGMLK